MAPKKTKAAVKKPAATRITTRKPAAVSASKPATKPAAKPAVKPAVKTATKKRASDAIEDNRRAKRPRTDEAEEKPRKTAANTIKPKAVKAPKSKNIINQVPSTRQNVYVFGDGTSGELGFGATKKATDIKRPRLNNNLDAKSVGVIALAVGGMHTVALTEDQKILTWGVNDNGALGRDTTWTGGLRDVSNDNKSDASDSEDEDPGLELNPNESLPTAVLSSAFPVGTVFVQIAAGDSCSFAVTDEGLVYGWGTFRNDQGIFGFTLDDDRKIVKQQNTPMLIKSLKNIVQIECGENHALALDNKGIVYAWGSGQQDQLGRRLVQRHAEVNLLPTPIALPKRGKIVSIAAGPNHSFAVTNDGEVWSWGLNSFAQTGIPYPETVDNDIVTGPTKVTSLKGHIITMMAAGGQHSLALTRDGTTLSFGRMDNFALGLDSSKLPLDDDTVVRKDENGKPRVLFQPTALKDVPTARFISCGTDHNIVITKSGKAYSWGFNESYQCGQGGEESNIKVPTLIGNGALKDQELVWAGCGGQFSVLSSNA
ncbi:putative Ran exchange factor Prp20/Pim1 [Tothia fuscella]|uniref:Ran exchange factor Prp20/Pim1 n=1 Tax=Tothia fuscella TaxID=1048955 RepID=A0A9P4NKA6_9PEZI|nr:putative Ran exchange factor Prp20/Pim1 [Tothia fuscella]